MDRYWTLFQGLALASRFFWDNTSTYFIGYKTQNKTNQLKGDRIGVIPRCRAWFSMDIAQYCYTPNIINIIRERF
jgi:hypothetical protein